MSFMEQPYGELVDSTARFVTWNTWGRFGPWEARFVAICETLAALKPDIVALQECWIDDTGHTQAAALTEHLDLQHSCHSGGDLMFGSWGLGNAVVSRWPISQHQIYELPALNDGDWGGLALHAVIDGPRGPLTIYSVALDWPPHASASRVHALGHLATIIHENQSTLKSPLVVAGDLNAPPDSDELRMLTGRTTTAVPKFVLFDAWETAPSHEDGNTWTNENPWAAPALLPDRRIDYILTGWPQPGGIGSVTATTIAGDEPINGIVPSDHHAVAATIRY